MKKETFLKELDTNLELAYSCGDDAMVATIKVLIRFVKLTHYPDYKKYSRLLLE